VNGTFGLGMVRAVDDSDASVLERFFCERGERPHASICPLAHPSLVGVLGERGWTPVAFENVLVRPIDPAEKIPPVPDGVDVRVAREGGELELWAALVANGFSAPEDPLPAELRLATAATGVFGSSALIGYVDGEPAGAGELHVDGDVAWLSADTTLPQFRRRGVHAALQRARLDLAREAGCTIAVTESMPGSASQRNMSRLGFDIAYTRVEVAGPACAGRR
jgi:GNAT superfamily N-acetyltransferase